MTPAVEPLSLRLPRDLLVLQPMQGHLDVEPVLLTPGLRCVIGSAEGCAIRLTKSALVRPEHCVVEVLGRQTLLTEWEPGATWLNDRLVSEPSDLVPGDRIAIGPFDFRVRAASADELLYAKLVERDSSDANEVEDVLRLKRAIDSSGRDKNSTQPGARSEHALDLFGNLLRESSEASDSDAHERLTEHISKLFSDLQSQVLALQEREAELNEQLRSRREETEQSRHHAESKSDTAAPVSRHATVRPDSLPPAVRPEYEEVLRLLKSERDQLDQDRAQLAEEQARWQEQQRDWAQRLQTLESQLAELETQRQSVLEERDACRTLAAELMRDEARMAEWEDRLRHDEKELAACRSELNRLEQEHLAKREVANVPKTLLPEPTTTISAGHKTTSLAGRTGRPNASANSDAKLPTSRPTQTLLTLIAFSSATLFLSGSVGSHEANTALGWGTAILGAISTVDLLLRRCFSAGL